MQLVETTCDTLLGIKILDGQICCTIMAPKWPNKIRNDFDKLTNYLDNFDF